MPSNVLFVTHSDRPFQEERASLNGLVRRFAGKKFDDLPPYESFPGVDEAVPFKGKLTIWELEQGTYTPRLLACYTPNFKPQYAIWHENQIVLLGSDRIECLDASLQETCTIRHRLIVGGHTVIPAGPGKVWVTTAPGNAALLVNLKSGDVDRVLSMPERYGTTYPITDETNLIAHYPPTDLQPTHINCLWQNNGELYVTLLRPGVLGVFTPDGAYREIVSGFIGCHGGRVSLSGELYFSDTPAGLVWFADKDSGALLDRFSVQSRWVHDCAQVDEDVFVCTLSDDNVLRLMSRTRREIVADVDVSGYGASALFVHSTTLPQEALAVMRKHAVPFELEVRDFGDDIAPPPAFWRKNYESIVRFNLVKNKVHIVSSDRLNFESLLETGPIYLAAGTYRLSLEALCTRGGVFLSLEAYSNNTILSHVLCDASRLQDQAEFSLSENTVAQLALHANNTQGPGAVNALIQTASLQGKTDGGELPLQGAPNSPLETTISFILSTRKAVRVVISGANTQGSTRISYFLSNIFLCANGTFSRQMKLNSLAKKNNVFILNDILLGNAADVSFDYLLATQPVTLNAGSYTVKIKGVTFAGSIAMGIEDISSNKWICPVCSLPWVHNLSTALDALLFG